MNTKLKWAVNFHYITINRQIPVQLETEKPANKQSIMKHLECLMSNGDDTFLITK